MAQAESVLALSLDGTGHTVDSVSTRFQPDVSNKASRLFSGLVLQFYVGQDDLQ